MANGIKVGFVVASKESGFKSGSKDDCAKPDYKEGQIIFVLDTNEIYLDFEGSRCCYSTLNPPPKTINYMNYLGIVDDEPLKQGELHLIGTSEPLMPKERDVVVFGKKEYMYRYGVDDKEHLKWYEMGDEDKESNWIS